MKVERKLLPSAVASAAVPNNVINWLEVGIATAPVGTVVSTTLETLVPAKFSIPKLIEYVVAAEFLSNGLLI